MTRWIALFVLMYSSASLAGPAKAKVDARQLNQTHRIVHGVANGSLTRWETGKLVSQQRAIAHTQRVFSRDGHIGVHERRTLNSMQNAASGSIYRQKHDRQRRR